MHDAPRGQALVTRSAPPEFALTLLGGFRLTANGAHVELPIGTQHLVALLALRGRTSRSRVAGTMWPETSEARALASLRTCVWRTNRLAPGLVTGAGTSVELRPETVIDVHGFIDHARGVIDQSPGAARSVEFPADLGDLPELLPDWQEDWLLADRERLRQLRLHMVEAVAEQLAAAGAFGLALEAALAAVRADPLRESAHRTVIRIHLAEGNQAEALRTYAFCKRALEQEMGVQPSPATTQLLFPSFNPDIPGPRRPTP